VAPVQRRSDGEQVGIEITNLYGALPGDGLASIQALSGFNDRCIAYGVPSIQTLVGSEQISKDKFTDHLVNRFGFRSIIGKDRNYAWLSISLRMWGNRQWQFIKERRAAAAHTDVAFKNTRFQADERSRTNLNEMLAAVAGGWNLPENYTWRDSENADVAITLDELKQLAALMAAQHDAAYRASWQSRAAIDTIDAGAELSTCVARR